VIILSSIILVTFGKKDKEKADYIRKYIKEFSHIKYIKHIDHGTYDILVRPLLSRIELDFWYEVLEALSEKSDFIEQILNKFDDVFTIEIMKDEADDDRIVAMDFGIWFHGQHCVNNLLEKYNIQFEMSYEGETKITARVSKPITREKLETALKLILIGKELYHRIREAQERVAEEIAKEFIKEHFSRKIDFDWNSYTLSESEMLFNLFNKIKHEIPSDADSILYYDSQKDLWIWFDPKYDVAYVYKFKEKIDTELAVRTIIESKRCPNCGLFHYRNVYFFNQRKLIPLTDFTDC